jgi:hypothetical protein
MFEACFAGRCSISRQHIFEEAKIVNITSVSSTAANSLQKTSPAQSKNTRAADGDYLTKGPDRSSVKDADGDYKPSTTASRASSSVQQALTDLATRG